MFFQLTDSDHEKISQFVSITKIINWDNAKWILEEQNWDLEKALAWFYEHKDDEENLEYFGTEEDEESEENQGIYIVLMIGICFWIRRRTLPELALYD